jgi:hypothetical protein
MSDHYCCKHCGDRYDRCQCPTSDMNRDQMLQRITDLELVASYAQDVLDYWPKMSIRSINIMSAKMASLKEAIANLKR